MLTPLYIQNYWVFGLFHRLVFQTLENTSFRKPDLFPSSGEGGKHLLSKVPYYITYVFFLSHFIKRALHGTWLQYTHIQAYIRFVHNFVCSFYGCETLSLTLREEHRLRVSENRVLRRIFGPKRNEGVGKNCIMRSFITYTLLQV
jgi:hypothetical protein